MGDEFNPFLVEGDPSQAAFKLHGLEPLAELSSERLERRRRLLVQVDAASRAASDRGAITNSGAARIAAPTLYDEHVATAWQTLSRAQSAGAFDVSREPPAVRERYGWTKFGQSLLAARRLVEAGVPLVTVNWDDDSRGDKVSPFWDTHHNNFARLKDGLCPNFDRAFAAFLADLADRGLLDTTLVAASGEFGRTPRIGLITQNGMTEKTGRDHWPHAFTALLAGGGGRGGQTYGETNNTGGYVADNPVTPADLSATVLHHLGINPRLEYEDRFQRMPQRLSEGLVIRGLG